MEEVLGRPRHPYTQLLKASVLEPDPRQRQTDRVTLVVNDAGSSSAAGCRFADRCPFVMERCRTVEPPDLVADGRMVKCHLFADDAAATATSQSAQPASGVR